MRFAQKEYTDSKGEKIDASEIDGVTTYYRVADGFYEWYCFNCGEVIKARGYGRPIEGQVLKCPDCKQMNLLLTSSTDDSQKEGRN